MSKAIYTKKSICVCGFPTLKETIQLGETYRVDVSRQTSMLYRCGGCGELIISMAIWTFSHHGSPSGWLPKGIFKIHKEKPMNPKTRILYDEFIQLFDELGRGLSAEERLDLIDEILGHLKCVADCIHDESKSEQ